MIKDNWNVFRAKFSENPQKSFEWFCYILFCKEIGQLKGIFRYKNQAAIETEPVRFQNKLIGWQARFYEATLSEHTSELLDTLKKTKKYYPSLDIIRIFSNQEWGQYRGGKPKGLKKIETEARKLNLQIEWKLASYFASPFVLQEAEEVSKYFFCNDFSNMDIIRDCERDTETKLLNIKNSIQYKNQRITIDHSKTLEAIGDNICPFSIIAGEGGIGKTGLIKEFHERNKDTFPIYLFRPAEFELPNLEQLFARFNYHVFFKVHVREEGKTLIIDSAEKIMELRNPEPLIEFLAIALKGEWKIVFTTRNNYLDVISNFLLENYGIPSAVEILYPIRKNELIGLSERHEFILPKDAKLLEYLTIPFNLNVYLQLQTDESGANLEQFKRTVWNSIISKSLPSRSEVFVSFVLRRVQSGSLYLRPNDSLSILDEFVKEGILSHEPNKGFYIAHDIYEEWALEQLIMLEFESKSNEESFLSRLGCALPIRRSLRKWLSEQLSKNNQEVIRFIEAVERCPDIPEYWKDEVLVSMLVSKYSKIFFENNQEKLFSNGQSFLNKIIWLLQIACTEVDLMFFQTLGVPNLDPFSLNHIPTKPWGMGWVAAIEYIYNNSSRIGVENLGKYINLLREWSRNNNIGGTTKYCGLLALAYYRDLTFRNVYYAEQDGPSRILEIIADSAKEIKEEIKALIAEIVSNKWLTHSDPFSHLSRAILTNTSFFKFAQTLPQETLKIAELFWSPKDSSKHQHSYYAWSEEERCGLDCFQNKYFPASAYQTPTLALLRTDPHATIQFILNLSESLVTRLAKNDKQMNRLQVIDIQKNSNGVVKVFSDEILFCAYRGTGIQFGLYESMYMALENYLLRVAKEENPVKLEALLLKILADSKTISSVAVIIAVVLAYPRQTFNVARTLFLTRELFRLDFIRWFKEKSHKESLISLRNMGRRDLDDIYWDERIECCDMPSRQVHLENLFLDYQLRESEYIQERQNILWAILDNYYADLPPIENQSEEDKNWRIALARMDSRKMKYEVQQKAEQTRIIISPILDTDLLKISNRSQEEFAEKSRYYPLLNWATARLENGDCSSYAEYENSPIAAFSEMKVVYSILTQVPGPFSQGNNERIGDGFQMYYSNLPVLVSCVMLGHYIGVLSEEDKGFCAKLLINWGENSLTPDYLYQVGDGAQYVFKQFPKLLTHLPQYSSEIKEILFLHLLKADITFNRITVHVIRAFILLWDEHYQFAQELYLSILLRKMQYDDFQKQYRKYVYGIPSAAGEWDTISQYMKAFNLTEDTVWVNTLSQHTLDGISRADLYTLNTFLQILPNATLQNTNMEIAKRIITRFAEVLYSSSRDESEIDSALERDHLWKLAILLLKADNDDYDDYFAIILQHIKPKPALSRLLEALIIAEDQICSYDRFWAIWERLKPYIISFANARLHFASTDEIIQRYLFVHDWKETAMEWHSLKQRDKRFFTEMCKNIGHHDATLFSITSLINGVGSIYLPEGFNWIAGMLNENDALFDARPREIVKYHLLSAISKYAFKNIYELRKQTYLYKDVLSILEYLIKHGSNRAYLMRERII